MYKNFYLTAICTLFAYAIIAQPSILWQKKFGGSGIEGARALALTPDGGFIMCGFAGSNDGNLTENQGASDYWIVKTDVNGVIEWQTDLGGLYQDVAFSVICTSDGGYAVSGNTASNDGDVQGSHGAAVGDFWLVKLSSTGEVEWNHCYGGTGFDNGYAVIQTAEGGYALCGDVGSENGDVESTLVGTPDIWLVKLDSQGGIEWENCYGGASGEHGYALVQNDDGEYVIAGSSQSWDSGVVTGNHGSQDFWVIKTTSMGDLVWQKSFGGSQMDIAQSIVKASNNTYVIAGTTGSEDNDVTGFHGAYDFWIIKINNDGELIWQHAYGGYDDEKAYSIDNTSDDGFVVTGFAKSNDGNLTNNHGDHDVWVIKLDSDGLLQWQKNIGGGGSDDGYAVKEISANNYVVLGSSSSIDGDATSSNGSDDFWLIRLSGTTAIDENPATQVNFFPNPYTHTSRCTFNSSNGNLINSTIHFYDYTGKEIFAEKITSNYFNLDESDLPQGLFSYTIQTNDGHLLCGKIIHQ